MRFLVALASIVLGLALVAGYIYRDGPRAEVTSSQPQPKQPSKIGSPVKPTAVAAIPRIVAPKVVGEIADEQPTILNADRSRFQPVTLAQAPKVVTQHDKRRKHRVLVMALQGELRRVGCYDGAIDGQWSVGSKAAMFWFLKRINAKLPVSQPDDAHLSLLKSKDKDFCAEKEVTPAFVTTVKVQDHIAEGIPNPTSTIQSNAYSEARQRAGLPSTRRVATNAGPSTASDDLDLPAPMAVGRVEQEEKKRRRYRARDRQVENLFKHPLNRF